MVVPTTADAAVVICQRKNKVKLRIDVCKGKETPVDAAELGVTGPEGPQGPEGPSNLLAALHIRGTGTLVSAHTADGIAANVTYVGLGSYRIELTGAGKFVGITGDDLIVQATAQSDQWAVANAYGDVDETTDDAAVVYAYTWISDAAGGSGDTDNDVYVVIYQGAPILF